MSSFSIPSLDSSGANSLAGVLAGSGIPFTLSPSTSGGYGLETDSANASTVQSMLNSAGLLGGSSSSSSSDGYGTLAGIYGGADTSNDGASSSATTGSGLNNNGSTDSSTAAPGWFGTALSKYGTDGAAIAIGIVFVAGSVYGMMTK